MGILAHAQTVTPRPSGLFEASLRPTHTHSTCTVLFLIAVQLTEMFRYTITIYKYINEYTSLEITSVSALSLPPLMLD